MKKLIAIITLALAIALITPPAEAMTTQQAEPKQQTYTSIIDIMIEMEMQDKKLQIKNRILELKQYVGKTRYFRSGSTPNGWDCSGLVLWFYSDFNIELVHSATAQKESGFITDQPLPGDIVSFSYPGSKRVYHNGIYVGDGKMIHSPRPGRRTELREIDNFHVNHQVIYTRIIESGKLD